MKRLFSLVHVRTPILGVLGGCLAIAVAIGAQLVAWDSDPATIWGAAVGVPLAALAVVLPVVVWASQPRLHLDDLDRMLAGQAWAHWRYDEADWRAANEAEARRDRRSAHGAAWMALVVGLVILGAGLLGVPGLVSVGAMITGLYLVLIAVVAVAGTGPAARRATTGEIFVSPLGVYRRPGGYVMLFAVGVGLVAVELVEGDVLVIRFIVQVVNRFGTRRLETAAEVAVPRGHEAEARALVERFRTEVLAETR
ncbi:hypothetical protein [Dactylosporangium salmoneum]|uniref:hypothetical protein n=1 Tax=Dactylosporangium salmoneum TaxID=53361 RepID=UPI0031D3769D